MGARTHVGPTDATGPHRRQPVSEKRLFVTPRGDIGYSLKTPN